MNRIISIVIMMFIMIIIADIVWMNLYRRNPKMDYNIEMTRALLYRVCSCLEEIKQQAGKYPISEGQSGRYFIPEKCRKSATALENRYCYEFYNSDKRTSDTMFQYLSNGSWFVLFGAGPDEKFEQENIAWIAAHEDAITSASIKPRVVPLMYDPTNGLKSPGDMIITSRNLDINLYYLGEKDRLKVYY